MRSFFQISWVNNIFGDEIDTFAAKTDSFCKILALISNIYVWGKHIAIAVNYK